MIALISGIDGYLGKHLSDTLLGRGYQVTGIPSGLFTNVNELTDYLLAAHPDFIFHTLSYGHEAGMDDVDQMMATNIFNTYILLKCSSVFNLKKFVYIGTLLEYGKSDRAMKETDLLKPFVPYAITKACATLLTRMFKNTLVVRPFSMFGEGEKSDRFIPTIVKCLKNDTVMALNEESSHDWIYVRDAAYAIVLAAESNLTGVINIGNGKQFTNLEIIHLLEGIAKKKLNHVKREGLLRSYDSNYLVANINKLKSIGYQPIYGMRCGLKKTYDYY